MFLSSLFWNQFIPESARYNVSAGNVPAAVATLRWIAEMNRASLPEGRLVEPALVRQLWEAARTAFGRTDPRVGFRMNEAVGEFC